MRTFCVWHMPLSAITPGDSQMSDVNTILSQHSCSAPVDSAHVFFYEVSASQIWFSSFAADFCFSWHYCLSQKTRISQDVPEIRQLQFCLFFFFPPVMFQYNLLKDSPVPLTGGPGYPQSLPPPPYFKSIIIFILATSLSNFWIFT